MRILTDRQEAILKDERQLLNNLRLTLNQFGISPQDARTLGESIAQLDELFLLVVVGEFNAGKSAFINALLGQKLLKEGVTPTTTSINVLRYAPDMSAPAALAAAPAMEVVSEKQHILYLPIDWLSEISIVDTPGTNAIIREHEAITSQFVPRADLVLFITSADRPFTESERLFLEHIRDWGKKVVMVINKIDIFESQDELAQVTKFVAENTRQLLGLTPEIFPISSRLALRAKLGDSTVWDKSRFEALERYIQERLDETSRIRLKLLNPLGVGSHLISSAQNIVSSHLDLLKDDTQMLSDVDAQLEIYKQDMFRDFNYRMADLENLLFEMEQRGDVYFDETFRLARVMDLLRKERIQREFQQKVIADAPQQIEAKVNELIDWLVETDLRQWQAVNDHLAERRRAHQERIVGETGGGSFNYDRDRLIEAVGREAQRVVDTYDREFESESIARGAQEAVAASAAVEVGAIGLGTLVTIIATTLSADVTGILLASLLAALGFVIIPARRKIAKNEMRTKIAALRSQLARTLREQFEKEMDRSIRRINEAIAPYSRFIRAEQGKLLGLEKEFQDYQLRLEQLKASIEEL